MGDELMAMGEAVALSKQYGGDQIVILDRHRKRRWHPIYEGAPYMRRLDDPREGIGIQNGPGCRPYIASHDAQQFVWQRYRPVPANLHHITGWNSPEGYIVIEPRLKPGATANKQWPVNYWRELVDELTTLHGGRRPVVLGAVEYPGADLLRTPTFSDLVITMRFAALYVGHEGGLHHLAAALGVPAVVIFGGYIGPENTGYDQHHNLTAGGPACGQRLKCPHCIEAMQSITPGQALDAARAAIAAETKHQWTIEGRKS